LRKGFSKKVLSVVDKEIAKLGISPFRISRTACLPNRFPKLGLPAVLGKRAGEHRDMPDLSSEERRKQILDQARTEVIRSIRRTK
jgi:hypothetical protein